VSEGIEMMHLRT